MKWALLFVALAGCSTARPVDEGRSCATPTACATVHPPGITDPSSPDFHASLIVASNYQLDGCKKCHGDDFSGGSSGKSCLGCHTDGPTSCTTCHGQPPSTGAHLRHAQRFDCGECHVKPGAYTDVGHLFDDNGELLAKPRITFGALATTNGAQAYWDGTRCVNVYCHGDAAPAWNGGPSQATCGSCHAIPPSTHAGRNAQCSLCHGRVVDASNAIVDASLHVDGKVSIGDDSGTCSACHPQLDGAHASHLQATHRIAPALGCGDCHFVPTGVDDPGHIDHPSAIVFPSGTSVRARTSNAQPAYDAASTTCSDVYCHGGGALFSADRSSTVLRAPSWLGNGDAATCGGCHGIPPVDAAHPPTMQLTDCHRCHRTVDATGALQPATHLNGIVDGP